MNLSHEFEKAVNGMKREDLLKLRLELSIDCYARQTGEFKCVCNPEGRCLNPYGHTAVDGLLLIATQRELRK